MIRVEVIAAKTHHEKLSDAVVKWKAKGMPKAEALVKAKAQVKKAGKKWVAAVQVTFEDAWSIKTSEHRALYKKWKSKKPLSKVATNPLTRKSVVKTLPSASTKQDKKLEAFIALYKRNGWTKKQCLVKTRIQALLLGLTWSDAYTKLFDRVWLETDIIKAPKIKELAPPVPSPVNGWAKSQVKLSTETFTQYSNPEFIPVSGTTDFYHDTQLAHVLSILKQGLNWRKGHRPGAMSLLPGNWFNSKKVVIQNIEYGYEPEPDSAILIYSLGKNAVTEVDGAYLTRTTLVKTQLRAILIVKV